MKAKQYYVRGMIGHTESEQGFIPIEIIPIFNSIKNKETMLGEFIEDVNILNEEHFKLRSEYEELKEVFILFKNDSEDINNEFSTKLSKLTSRIQDLELFSLE